MSWHFTDDVDVYAERAWDLLASRPAENTVALTVIENVRAGRRWSPAPMLFGWYAPGGRVSGAVNLTPPYELLLAVVPPESIDELVAALRTSRVEVPGIIASVHLAEAFAAAWAAATGVTASVAMSQRLYRLDDLRPLDPLPPGRARLAGDADLPLAVEWWTQFHLEAHLHATELEPLVRSRIDERLEWLWDDATGRTVSLAGRNVTTAGVARVGPVYTPPIHRRRGYGAAVTAACTRDALDRGATEVVLTTHLSNPTSNSIYQQIGYVPVRDQSLVRFSPLLPGGAVT